MIVNIETEEQFREKTKGRKVFIDFWASWCGPCKMLIPVLEKVDEEVDIDILKINVDDHQNLAQEFKVRGIPAMFIVDDGNIVTSITGFQQASEIIETINEQAYETK